MSRHATRIERSAVVALGLLLGTAAHAATSSPYDYADGYARPLALAIEPKSGLLLAALSTDNAVAAIDPTTRRERARLAVCAFPQALVPTADGVIVSCRFSDELGLIAHDGRALAYRQLVRLPGSGRRGVALSDDGKLLYVASPPSRGVEVVEIARGVVQTVTTGLSPRRVLLARDPRTNARVLLVDNYVSHTIVVLRVLADGRLGEALQTIRTEAPIQDLAIVAGRLLLLTHEDRPLDRAEGPVHWLDSVVLTLPPGRATPFADAGPRRRASINLTERDGLAQPDAIAVAADGRVAIVGSATDSVLLAASASLAERKLVAVGAHPSAALFLPDGGLVTADRLSDSLTFVDRGGGSQTLSLKALLRQQSWAFGELLFYSRALVPNNRADGPLSVYACSACHDEGHIDGRRHPAKRNRFRSMTKTCRGLAHTAPYLSLGEIDSLRAFADNILSTHAQGDTDYSVSLRVLRDGGWTTIVLSPDEVREAMAAYLARIPLERSPFSDPRMLDDDARRGLEVFLGECASCHRPTEDTHDQGRPAAIERAILEGRLVFTSLRRFDVGTPVIGEGGNNPPSLRGAWDDAPYFSDGSADSLEAVLLRTDPSAGKVHSPQNAVRPKLDARVRRWLLAFLRAL